MDGGHAAVHVCIVHFWDHVLVCTPAQVVLQASALKGKHPVDTFGSGMIGDQYNEDDNITALIVDARRKSAACWQ